MATPRGHDIQFYLSKPLKGICKKIIFREMDKFLVARWAINFSKAVVDGYLLSLAANLNGYTGRDVQGLHTNPEYQ